MGKGGDVEAGFSGGVGGAALYPSMAESPELRWGFIRKVYSIVAFQILITVAVAAVINFVHPIRNFFLSHTPASIAVLIVIVIAPILLLIPMALLRDRHPINFILLMLFTVCISWAIGLSCTTRSGKVILEAAALTAAVVVSLTLYTFWAAKRGYDFNFLGPFLCAATMVLFLYCIIQIFFPLGKLASTIYGCIAALVFSGFIIYDTDNLIKRYSYDEYIVAAISLYLDIINLFSALLAALDGCE